MAMAMYDVGIMFGTNSFVVVLLALLLLVVIR
jgi:hypothetical protein